MTVEVLCHVDSWRTWGALFPCSLDCTILVDGVQFKSEELYFSVSVLYLLLGSPCLLLLLFLLTTIEVSSDVIHEVTVYKINEWWNLLRRSEGRGTSPPQTSSYVSPYSPIISINWDTEAPLAILYSLTSPERQPTRTSINFI